MFRLRRCGSVPRVVPVAAVRAGLFSALGTSVSFMVHHLAFDSSPSWNVRLFAAFLLFAVALPGSGRDKSLPCQLLLAFGCQAVVGYWFVRADGAVNVPAHEMWPSSFHAGWPVVAGHVVLTVIGAVLLCGVDTCRRRLLYVAGREWEAFRALLRKLFAPVSTPLDLAVAKAAWIFRSGPARVPPARVALADIVVRRGPPSSLPLAV